jgi:hypothetical protein
MEDALTRHGGRRAHKENGVTWYGAPAGERVAVRVSKSRYQRCLRGGRIDRAGPPIKA